MLKMFISSIEKMCCKQRNSLFSTSGGFVLLRGTLHVAVMVILTVSREAPRNEFLGNKVQFALENTHPWAGLPIAYPRLGMFGYHGAENSENNWVHDFDHPGERIKYILSQEFINKMYSLNHSKLFP
jgi:hypothetical protein